MADSVNDAILAASIRHAVASEKYGRGLAGRIVSMLDPLELDIIALIAERLAAGRAAAGTQRLEAILVGVRTINEKVYKRVYEGLRSELADRAVYEAEFQGRMLDRLVVGVDFEAKLPSARFLKALAENHPIQGFVLKSWTDKMSENQIGRITQELHNGLNLQETNDQLIARIRGTRAKGYTDGVLNISRNSAKTLAVTANSTVSNAARAETYKANASVIKMLKWVSVLDTRTTPVCQSLDGKTWKLDEPHPEPPLHPNCRSIIIPITKSFDELGIKLPEPKKGTRASMNGQVPADTTYGDWLQSQPASVQDEVLGIRRAKLFRSGKLKFEDMFRTDGTYRSLKELQAAERN